MSWNQETTNSGYQSYNSGAVAAGTTAGTIQAVAAVNYTFDGVFLQKAITNNIPVVTAPGYTLAVIPPNSSAQLAFWLDSAGAVTATQGLVVAAGGVAPNAPYVSGRTCFAVVKVTTNSATTFTPNVTAFGAAGVTSVFRNVCDLPGANA